jgi:dTDP-4-amino-4,6-dideoxygalactose transaminase
LLRDHGRPAIGEVAKWGLNSRLDNLHAAILDFKLTKYPLDIDRRRAIASMYQVGLGEVKEMILPLAPGAHPDKYEIFQNYEVEAEAKVREKLRKHMTDNGVGSILQWGGKAVHEFKGLKLRYKLPNTERLMRRCFLLPMNTGLNDTDVAHVISVIRKYYGYDKE